MRRAVLTTLLVTAALVMPTHAAAEPPEFAQNPGNAAPEANLLSDTVLDPSALYFVSYDGIVNNNSFQQDAIRTYAGYQYAAWYTDSRNAVVGRKPLHGNGGWQTVTLPHELSVDDSHNVISLGISPADGRLHVAMDTHNSRIHYVRSVAGLASRPAAHPWTSAMFGEVQRTLGDEQLGAMTYPRFLVTPQGKLQFSYRTGGSGDGVNELAEYADGSWDKLGGWSSATGAWTAPNGEVSTTRNMYLHGLTYDDTGRLHASFTWREGNRAVLCDPGGLANHDTGYVYSDDQGRTWHNGAGETVGVTGRDPVGVNSPGIVADPLGPNHGLMNQESQAVDSTSTPHAVISYVPGRFTQCVTDYSQQRSKHARTFHLVRGDDGDWTKREVPVPPHSTQRTQLVFDQHDNAYLIMPKGKIVAASAASDWTDWTVVFNRPDMNAFGEVNVDTSRLAADGVLSVLYQESSTGTTPSPIHVANLRLG
ncbi:MULTISPECIES: BNR repeat-containing protein [unclassified Actinopolyspora]|uniref:BNR repeat-containing protein n=1 Tax=unclassified Actinopolyspora TaxID=2639451 RepID=UPI0013F5BC15|nr:MULTISPECIES: BNR repeat-containing protein [unclassified Actinopolyspora]NHD19394.1 Tat pathway signal sequence domain protein [Actinopolyspora sp. BKK2]NHE78533.1 Tat pathway signal sequence domain protein [Actinopolyspora sp. BKK1]